MIKFFRKIRQQLLAENRFTKYLIYALGEIILVVVGILIALQINNRNEQNKREKEIHRINERLILDIDNDIRELYSSLVYWENKIPVFEKVSQDSVTLDLFNDGFTRLIGTIRITSFNKTGVQQLKTLNVNDDLSLMIVQLYNEMENTTINPVEMDINDKAHKVLDHFKDNYDWFPEWVSTTIMKDNSSKELQEFFLHSQRYRNEVSLNHLMVAGRYIPSLKFYIGELEEIRTELKSKTDKDFIPITKEELDIYIGSYSISKMEGDTYGFDPDQQFQIESFDGFLRLSDSIWFSAGLYVQENNAFQANLDGLEVDLSFSNTESSSPLKAKLIMVNQEQKGTFYLNRME